MLVHTVRAADGKIVYRIQYVFILLLCACSSTQNDSETTPNSFISNNPDTITPSKPTESSSPSETKKPIESTSSQTPDTTQAPVTSRPVNTFSPIDPEAGKAFVNENDLANVSRIHGISRFLVLTKKIPHFPSMLPAKSPIATSQLCCLTVSILPH